MREYDVQIVGAGLFGAVVAERLRAAGRRVVVIEAREMAGGNCADAVVAGQLVNTYGGHIFHTRSERVWAYAQQFGITWRPIRHKVLAQVGAQVYSFPVNLMTLHQLWGVTSAAEAEAELERRRLPQPDPHASMESWCLHHLGEELYETFIRHYSERQWGRSCAELPASIIRRLPVRMTWDDGYFSDPHEAVPLEGYSAWIERMLDGVPVRYGLDFCRDWPALAPITVWSGPIDRLFAYAYGALGYRSLRWEWGFAEGGLGIGTMNTPGPGVAHTRRIDYATIRRESHRSHVVAREYPMAEGEPMYPVRSPADMAALARYQAAAAAAGIICGGRLGSYQYLDMDQTIGQALKTAEELCA